jgi:hypothetical protein
MARVVSDDDIEVFLRRNAADYPWQISLIQAAVRLLLPHGAPSGSAERVVRVCLGYSIRGLPAPAGASTFAAPLLPWP